MTPQTVFTYHQFQEMLAAFTGSLPALLSRLPDTTDLARQVDDLLDLEESPFTVAVMGQMRSGKSTLLNALIGRDLAVTGVNETTATINWFKYAADAEGNRFRVEWKDSPGEMLPLSRLKEWTGDSQNARRTRHLEFYAASEFLKTANIVDTPGTRSVIEDHTNAVAEFLHGESVRQGCKADALIYVLMPVGRENDEKWLREFEQTSRLPGANPYNSLAVVHKWEALLDVDDPAGAAERKAEMVHRMLAGKLSCVIPVSAPLAICSDRLAQDEVFWSELLRLGRESSDEAFNLITMQEDYYSVETEGCSLSLHEREALRERAHNAYPGLPWPSFKVMIRAARELTVDTPEGLLNRVSAMSGFARLRKELHERYFARSKTIKAFSILAKAWHPCQVAQSRLRNLKAEMDVTLKAGDSAQRVLEVRTVAEPALRPALDYIRQSRSTVEARFRAAQETLAMLGQAVTPVQTAYEDMERELGALEKMEDCRERFPPEWYDIVHGLLGGLGPELENRLRVLDSKNGNLPVADDFSDLCERLRLAQQSASGEIRSLFETAVTRAEQIANALEKPEQTIRANQV